MRFLPVAFVLAVVAAALASTGYFRGITFSVPRNDFFAETATKIQAFELPLPPPLSDYWLGVDCECIPNLLRVHLQLEGGLVVRAMIPNGPADRAGLKVEDIILAVDGEQLSCSKSLSAIIQRAGQEELHLQVMREGKVIPVAVTPEPRPQCKVLVSPLLIPQDPSQLDGLQQSDIVAQTNPLTGELNIVVLGTGLVLSIDPEGRVRESKPGDLPWSVQQVNRLAIDYDWQTLSDVSLPKLLEILTLAIESAGTELNRLEREIDRYLAEDIVVQGQVEQLQSEATQVQDYIAGLRRLADALAERGPEASAPPPVEPDSAPEADRGRGPRDPGFRLIVGV